MAIEARAQASRSGRWRQRWPRVYLGVLCALSGPIRAWEVAPFVEITEIWSSNVLLAPHGEEEHELITSVAPGFRVGNNLERWQFSLDYRLQSLYFQQNDERNQSYSAGALRSNAELISERLFFDVNGRLSREIIDPAERVAFDVISLQTNATDVAYYDAGPRWVQPVGSAQLEARYQKGWTEFDRPELLDYEYQWRSVAIGSNEEARRGPLGWNLSLESVETTYEESVTVDFEEAALFLSGDISPTSQVFLRGGVETDFSQGLFEAEPEAEFWLVGYRAAAGERHELEISAGRRFFGRTYNFDWTRSARFLTIGFQYAEDVTNFDRALATRRLSIADLEIIGDGTLPEIDFQVHLSKRYSGNVSVDFSRTSAFLTLYEEERTNLTTEQEQRVVGGTLGLQRQLSARSALSLLNIWQTFERADGALGELMNRRRRHAVTLTRTLSRALSFEAQASYTKYDRAFIASEYQLRVGLTWDWGGS